MGYSGTVELEGHQGLREALTRKAGLPKAALTERLLGGVLYAAIGAYLTLAVILGTATVGLMVSKLVLAWVS